jgi:hypothetical protein
MKHRLILVFISLLVFGLVLGAANSSAGSDPKFTLLVSQSIADNGTIRLDNYRDDLLLNDPIETHLKTGFIFEHEGHLYNYFPVGPSILTLPVVSMLRLASMDMRLVEDNFLLQKVMAGLTSVLMVWIIYAISRYFLEENYSLIIAAVSVLGTGLISSMGTALWTINFSTVFIGLSVLLLVRYESGKASTAHPIVLGVLLFLAFFSRASSAAFIIAALGYLLLKDRRQFLITGATSLLFLIIFMSWSRLEFGTWLPAYYSITRLQADRESIWIGILGNLISPSRGIFVFSPFFLLIIPGALLLRRLLARRILVWMAVCWFLLALLVISRAVNWWGGVSFGPRMMTENLLALIVLMIIIWSLACQRLGVKTRRIAAVSFVILSAVAIYIHSYQGLFNGDTAGWNLFIEAVTRPPYTGLGDFFDWGHPQFFATNKRNCDFSYQRYQVLLVYDTTLSEYHWGDPIWYTADQAQDFRNATILESQSRLTPSPPPTATPEPRTHIPQSFLPWVSKPSNRSILIGWQWYRDDRRYRQSLCQEAQIVFRLGQADTSGSFEAAFLIGAVGEQEVRVSINDTMVGSFVNTSPVDQPNRFVVRFDGSLLKSGDLNEIGLELPNASRPDPGLWHLKALTFYGASVYRVHPSSDRLYLPLATPTSPPYP